MTHNKYAPTTRFFDVINKYKKEAIYLSFMDTISNENKLKKVLYDINYYPEGNYLQDHFIYWLSAYANQSRDFLQGYFSGFYDLTLLCKNFINFCFKNSIFLDENKTLQSFNYHNELSDTALKQKLLKIIPKERINILGFGLDEGYYEKNLSKFLINHGIAKTVNIYGFDPYALKTPNIEYLMPNQIDSDTTPKFDVVIARWVLHHVALQHRWKDLINCINHCNSGAMVLIVEHGFLKKSPSFADKKLYYLLNATFDIIANIGLRPRYFTSTAPDLGANFFIRYLEPEDFNAIKNSVSLQITQDIFEIGPSFPNQTICSMSLK